MLPLIHSHYSTTKGDYHEECQLCRAIPVEDATRGQSCPNHIGQSHYTRRGCPTKDAAFANNHKQLLKHVNLVYASRQTFALLPCHLRDIIDYCIATNSTYYFMIYVILMVGVKGFLRVEEDLKIEMSDFQQEYSTVMPEIVVALAMKVLGKTEDDFLTILFWDDEECPEFSVCRLILLWVKVSGIKECVKARC